MFGGKEDSELPAYFFFFSESIREAIKIREVRKYVIEPLPWHTCIVKCNPVLEIRVIFHVSLLAYVCLLDLKNTLHYQIMTMSPYFSLFI